MLTSLYGPRDAAGADTYVLCEINASSCFAIPDEAPAAIARTVGNRLQACSFGGCRPVILRCSRRNVTMSRSTYIGGARDTRSLPTGTGIAACRARPSDSAVFCRARCAVADGPVCVGRGHLIAGVLRGVCDLDVTSTSSRSSASRSPTRALGHSDRASWPTADSPAAASQSSSSAPLRLPRSPMGAHRRDHSGAADGAAWPAAPGSTLPRRRSPDLNVIAGHTAPDSIFRQALIMFSKCVTRLACATALLVSP